MRLPDVMDMKETNVIYDKVFILWVHLGQTVMLHNNSKWYTNNDNQPEKLELDLWIEI